MRIGAITGSLVFHSALVAAAFSLPAASMKRAQEPVTIDLVSAQQKIPEPPPKLTPALPKEPPQKLAMRDPTPAPQHPMQEMITPTTPTTEPAPPSSTPPPAGKLDLTLHALPGGTEGSITIPDGTGTMGGVPGGTGKKPWKMRGDAGDPITGKLAEVKEDRFPLTPVEGGEYVYKGKSFHARIERDGRVAFDDKSIRDFKVLSGGFDLNDMLMRGKGQDPYRAEKQAFMELTEPLRKKMAQKALKERQAASLDRLPHNLDEVWHDTRRSALERRKTIYEMWLDAKSSQGESGEVATAAAETIEVYVRRHMEFGTENAFADDELDRLNRNKKYKFDPYKN